MYNREQLINMLRNQLVTVTFNKVNGDQRVMQCTLADQYIAGHVIGTGMEHDPNQIRVWDINENAWRSFRFENVTDVAPGPVLLVE